MPFDTVFNQSETSYLFGSPDIVDIFMNGRDNVHGYAYDESFEDFSKENSDYLDTWVLERVEQFFLEEKEEKNSEKEIYFFHLLGSDTNGHAHKPSSFQYKNNVNVVDDIARCRIITSSFFFTIMTSSSNF